jgi:hypothetical protein
MPTTSPDSLPYPGDGDPPDGPGQLGALAVATQAALTAIRAALSPPRVKVFRSANLTVSNLTWTLVTWDSEAWDTDTMHSTSTNTSRLVATTAGIYRVTLNVQWAADGTGARYVTVGKNAGGTKGAGTVLLLDQAVAAVNGSYNAQSVSFEVSLAANDYIEAWVYQASGASLALVGAGEDRSSMSMSRFSD